MNKNLLLLVTLFFFQVAAIASDCNTDIVSELENISYIESGENLIQIDIKVPESINGQEFTSAQVLQNDPFVFIQVAFPWKKDGWLSTQMHVSSKVFVNPEFQVFYGYNKCSSLLRKQIHITKPSN
jgi:hypothetical protein